MTTYYPFYPNQSQAFSFQPSFDGSQYLVTVRWNLFGLRWYVNITDLNGNPIVTLPRIESPVALPLASISWANNLVTIVTQQPHGYQIGLTIAVTIAGCAPAGYNGMVDAFVLDGETLTYPLVMDPGSATAIGSVDWFVNMVAGYFTTSTLVYRNQQFEVSP